MDRQYFINKICTIITKPINRDFTEKVLQEYFVVKILSISDKFIIAQHAKENLLSYFNMDNVIAIQEEIVLSASNPKDQIKIKELEEKKQKEEPKISSSSSFVSVQNLKNIIRDVKKTETNNMIQLNVKR